MQSAQESHARADDRRALVDLLPQFLTRAPRGWDGLDPLLDSAGLERRAFFLLRALVQERDANDGITRAEMHANLFNPYSTIRPILDALPALVLRGCVAQDGERYIVMPEGQRLVAHVEAARNAYLATLMPIATAGLERLVSTLTEIAEGLRYAPEPREKPHQARAWRAMPPADAVPMVRLHGVIYALWMARDDSHNAAWQAAGFNGPTFDLLSRVWSGGALTRQAFVEAVRQFQPPEDVTGGIASLVTAGYLISDGDTLRLTPHGTATRDRIEAETDRVYFASWPPFTSAEVVWLRTTLGAIIAGLSS